MAEQGQPRVNGMPMASVQPEPSPFAQAVPEHTSGSVVVVERSRVKMTRKSKSVYPKGNAIALAYMLKIPTPEPVFEIFNKYSLIRDLVFTFDRTHEESWFEAYPQAVLLEPGEPFPNRVELRANYRRYATRLAHFFYYYETVHGMRSAALLNLLTLSRFQGKTKDKDIASLCRWSFINRATADLASYPQPIGLLNAMIDAAKPARGTTANGVEALALPLFDTTVYGNLGNHAGSLKDGIIDIKPNTDKEQEACYAYQDSNDYEVFLQNCADTVANYYRAKSFDILNASTLVKHSNNQNNSKSAYISLQQDGRARYYDSDPVRSTSITDTAWRDYTFWSNVLARQFAVMRDPANDIYELAFQLKFVEKMRTAEQIMNAMHTSQFYDLTSLRNAMQYMHEGKANTATVVRQFLPLSTKDANVDAPSFVSVDEVKDAIYSADVFQTNFERIKYHEDTATEWIAQAKKWPGLTPRLFPMASRSNAENQAALVAGAISSDGSIAPISQGFMNAGKYASYFDYATHQTLDPAKSIVELSAVNESTAKSIIDNREGFICSEDPSQLFVKMSKFIDVSDPFQCGFYLLNEVPEATRSELEEFLANNQSYANFFSSYIDPAATRAVAPSKFIAQDTAIDGVPIAISITDSKSKRNVSPVFETTDWYSMIFLGDMPFVLPQARSILNSFALPVEQSQPISADFATDEFVDTPSAAIRDLTKRLQAEAALEVFTTAMSQVPQDKRAAFDKLFTDSAFDDSTSAEARVYNGKLGDAARNIDPSKAKFYLTYTDPKLHPTLPTRVNYRLTLDAWSKDMVGGTIEWLDDMGNFLSSEPVQFKSEFAIVPGSGIVQGQVLTPEQMSALQALGANGNNGKYVSTWRIPSSNIWDTDSKAAAKAANFMQRFVQVTEGGDVVKSGYTLGIQVPALSVVDQVAKSSQDDVKTMATAVQAVLAGSDDSVDATYTIGTTVPESIADASNFMALWRYATNVRFSKDQKSAFVGWYKDGNTNVMNPAVIIASLMFDKIGTQSGLELYMFNPQYGPVAIIAEPIPTDADYGFAPSILVDSDKVGQAGKVAELVPAMGVFQTDSALPARSNQRMSYQDTQVAAHLWRWSVKKFAFQQARMDGTRPVVQDGDPITFDDEIKLRWPLTMFAQIVVTFAGSGDIDFFDNIVGKRELAELPNVATIAPTTVNGLVFVPARLLTKPISPTVESGITGPNRTNQTYASKQQADSYERSKAPAPEYEKQSSGGGSKKGNFKKRKPDKRRNPSVEVQMTDELTPKEGGPLDASSKSTDNAVERKLEKPSKESISLML